jgi:hypothetical protein
MRWLRNIFSSPKNAVCAEATDLAPKIGNVFISRGGKKVRADEVFAATNSKDLPRMLAATRYRTNLVDRHFLLLNLVSLTYKNRKDGNMRQLCIESARLHITEFSAIRPHLIKEMDGVLPRVSTFQKLAMLYAEDGRFDEAIEVCRAALGFGLQDGTEAGFEGRIKRFNEKKGEIGSGSGDI